MLWSVVNTSIFQYQNTITCLNITVYEGKLNLFRITTNTTMGKLIGIIGIPTTKEGMLYSVFAAKAQYRTLYATIIDNTCA